MNKQNEKEKAKLPQKQKTKTKVQDALSPLYIVSNFTNRTVNKMDTI